MCYINMDERKELNAPFKAVVNFQPSYSALRNYKLEKELMLSAKVELRLLATLRERRGPYRWLPHAVRDGKLFKRSGWSINIKTHQDIDGKLRWVKENSSDLKRYIETMQNAADAIEKVSKCSSKFISEFNKLIKNSNSAANEWGKLISNFSSSNNQLAKMLKLFGNSNIGLDNSLKGIGQNYFGAISSPDKIVNNPVYDGLSTPLVTQYADFNDMSECNAVAILMEIENVDDSFFSSSNLFKQDSWYQAKHINEDLLNSYLKERKQSYVAVDYYDLYSERGVLIGKIEKRKYTQVGPSQEILLPVTFWEKTGDEVLFPLYIHFGKDIPLYNLQLLRHYPNQDILLCNSIEQAASRQGPKADVSMHDLLSGYKPIWMAWPSWPGDYSEVCVDFSPLKSRRVFYLIEAESEDSLKDLYTKAVKVYSKLKIIENLYFVERTADNEPRFMDKKGFLKKIHSMGLKLDTSRDDIIVEQGLAIRSAADLGEVKELEYVLRSIIPANSIVLAYSTFGIGKSFAALSFAYAITQGVNVCDRIKVEKAGKILYIDSEMGEDTMTERLGYMKKIYGTDKSRQENFLWYSVASEAHLKTLNLEEVHDQKLVDRMLENAKNTGTKDMPVSLLVLDNISTLTSGSNTHAAWMKIFSWLYRLKPECSVLILHHENKAGGYLGTVLKGITVDCKIHLESVEVKTKEVEFKLVVEKGRRIHGKAKEPFTMGVDLNSTDPKWVTSCESEISEKSKVKTMSPIERRMHLKKLQKSLGSNEKVAKFIGVSVGTVYNWLKVLRKVRGR